MSGDRGRHQFPRSCLQHGVLRLPRTIYCNGALVKRQKLFRVTSAASKRRRRSYWQSFSKCKASVGCLLWATCVYPVFSSLAAGAPLAHLHTHVSYMPSNNPYVDTGVNPGGSKPSFASATQSTALEQSTPQDSSSLLPNAFGRYAGHHISTPGPQSLTNLHGDPQIHDQSDDGGAAVTSSTNDGKPTASTAQKVMGWDTFFSLMGPHKKQSAATITDGVTVSSEVSALGGPTSTVRALPASVTPVALGAERTADLPQAKDEIPLLKQPQSQSEASADRSRRAAKATEVSSGEALVRLQIGDQRRRTDGHRPETAREVGKDTASNLREDLRREASPQRSRQELTSLRRPADFKATSSTTGPNSGWKPVAHQKRSTDLVNITDEGRPATSIESRALENMLAKILQQSTLAQSTKVAQQGDAGSSRQKSVFRPFDGERLFPSKLTGDQHTYTEPHSADLYRTNASEGRALEKTLMKILRGTTVPNAQEEGDSEYSLILRLFDGEYPAPSQSGEEQLDPVQRLVDNLALTTTQTSTAEDRSGPREGGKSVHLGEPATHGIPIAKQAPKQNGLQGAVAIDEATSDASKKSIAAQVRHQQTHADIDFRGAPILLPHSSEANAHEAHLSTGATHVESSVGDKGSSAAMPLTRLPTVTSRTATRQEEQHGRKVELHSRDRNTDAQTSPHFKSDQAEEQDDFLQLLLGISSSKATSGRPPTSEGTPPAGAFLRLPSKEKRIRTVRTRDAANDAVPRMASPPDLQATPPIIRSKGWPQEVQRVREEARSMTGHWRGPEMHEERPTSSELEVQSGNACKKQTKGCASSTATQGKSRIRDVEEAGFTTSTTGSPTSAEAVGKLENLPHGDNRTGGPTASPLKIPEVPHPAGSHVRGSVTATQASVTVGGAITPTQELLSEHAQSAPRKQPAEPKSLSSKRHLPSHVDLEPVVPSEGSATHGAREATLPSAANEKKRKRPVKSQRGEAEEKSRSERKKHISEGRDSKKTGTQQSTGRHSSSEESVSHHEQVPGIVIQQGFPEQARISAPPHGVQSGDRVVDVPMSRAALLRDPTPKAPAETLTQLLFQKQRLLSTISKLISNMGSGIKPYAAFLDKEAPEDQTAFLRVSYTYPEVLRARLYFRHSLYPTTASVQRFHREIRMCESMVEDIRLAVNLLEVNISSNTTEGDLCDRLLKQKLAIADQSVRAAESLAGVIFNSYKFACYYLQTKRIKDTLNVATTAFREIPRIFSTFVDVLLLVTPESVRLHHDSFENVCPFHQHQNAGLIDKEVSLQRELIEQLETLAEHLEVASRFEAALHKLATLLNRRPRVEKPAVPDTERTKTRARHGKRIAELYGTS